MHYQVGYNPTTIIGTQELQLAFGCGSYTGKGTSHRNKTYSWYYPGI